MKATDHSECDPAECIHRAALDTTQQTMAVEKKMAEEDLYYEQKRRAKLHGPEARGMAEVRSEDDAVLRANKVLALEEALLEARAEQARHGDPMPLQLLRNVVGDALRLLEAKEQQYGGAWRKQGYMGNLARIQSKTERLKLLLWREPDANGYPLPVNYTHGNNETVVDTALDLINLAAMFALNFSEDNRWG